MLLRVAGTLEGWTEGSSVFESSGQVVDMDTLIGILTLVRFFVFVCLLLRFIYIFEREREAEWEGGEEEGAEREGADREREGQAGAMQKCRVLPGTLFHIPEITT